MFLISNLLQTNMSSPSTSIPPLLLWTDVHASAAVFTPPLLVLDPANHLIANILQINSLSHQLFQILLSLTSISLVSILAWAALALLALVIGSRLYVYIMVIIIMVTMVIILMITIISTIISTIIICR